MRSFNHKVALETNSRLIAAATGFGGDKKGTFQSFIDALIKETGEARTETRQVSMQELVAMGKQIQEQIALESDEQRAEREAKDAAITELFARYRKQ